MKDLGKCLVGEEKHESIVTDAGKKHEPIVADAGKKHEPIVADAESNTTGTNWNQICESFDDMGLKDNLLRGVYNHGWEKPSYIQQRGIIPVISGKDTLAQAQSGKGKTGTFLIGALQVIEDEVREPQVVVLAPTRDLARQIYAEAIELTIYMDVKCHLCVGGTRLQNDFRAFEEGTQLVVGTPGRMKHLLEKGILRIDNLRLFILDEADEMLSRGFSEQIYDIMHYLPATVQVGLFSATMPGDIITLTERFMRDPIRIIVKQEDVTLDGIRQYYVDCGKREYKFDVICDLYECISISQCIIFCNRRREADWLHDQMVARDFTLSVVHAGLDEDQRKATVDDFRHGRTRVLISTDLLARGIDIADLSLVINYDVTSNKDNYIHRIGRSGRMGKKGLAINLIAGNQDWQILAETQAFYQTTIDELPEDVGDLMSGK